MGQLTTNKMATVRDMFERLKPQLAKVAPRHLTPDRIIRVAMTSIQRNPKLLECTEASLAGCVMVATQLGLETDSVNQRAHLIPYKVKGVPTCTLIVGYKGLMELARRSLDVLDIFVPQLVHVNDTFDYELGQYPKLSHKPADGDRGAVTHGYVVAHLASSERPFYVMTIAELEKVRDEQLAKAYNKTTSPWATSEHAMYLKTLIRRFAKWLPSSTELQTAVSLDERAEADIPQEIDFVDIDAASTPAETPDTAATSITDRAKAKAAAARKKPDAVPESPTDASPPEMTAPELQARILEKCKRLGEKAAEIMCEAGLDTKDKLANCTDVAALEEVNAACNAALDAEDLAVSEEAANLVKHIQALAKKAGPQRKIEVLKKHGVAMAGIFTGLDKLKAIALDLAEIADAKNGT